MMMNRKSGKRALYATLAAILCGMGLFVALGTGARPAAAATPSISLDAAAVSPNCHGLSQCSFPVAVKAGELVVAQFALNPQSEGFAPATLTLTSPQTTAFQTRLVSERPNADAIWVMEQWAVATTTGSVTITGNLALQGATINCSGSICPVWNMLGYSVNGANTTSPWDPNSSLAVTDFNDCNLSSGCSIGFSITTAPTLFVFGLASQGDPVAHAPPGDTMIAQASVPSCMDNAVAYHVFSTPQNGNTTGNWTMTGLSCTQQPGNACGESAIWWSDAIRAAVPSGTTTSSSSTTTSSSSSTSTSSSSSISTSTVTVTTTQTVTTTVTVTPSLTCTIHIVNGAVTGTC